ncbi:hypothetical protein [Sulfurovum sp. TSL1]|uniref:hypothetical protein n=1 Tax=Sulfurovum sp. TSL1 TaxID=2826994 RepID=UPI001CC34006|nr:hypothetical protein [Sulfurovum sp. TSL1]GIT98821.1 hypothetical protein TSL1_16420 [Sulfurovum sp. TSL1]
MNNESRYLKTSKMAKFLGYSPDFLKDNREIIFFENVHYFSKKKRIDWKVSKMVEWMENKNMSDKAREILDFVS